MIPAVLRVRASKLIAAAVLALVVGSVALAGLAGAGEPTGSPPGPRPLGDVIVLAEDFEGAFPGLWTVGDADPASGLDAWGTTTYRAFAGTRSAWSAQEGTGAPFPALVWYEDFEGAFPGAWTVGDADPASGDDYWGTTAYRSDLGMYSAWAAEVGDNSVAGSPNNVVHTYDNDMDASMVRTIDLTGYGLGALTYSYWLNIEPGVDALRVGFLDGGTWMYAQSYDGAQPFWGAGVVFVPVNATAVGFFFQSDGSVINEGAYVDEVFLYGLAGTPQWSEDFEGAFPGPPWSVSDSNPTNGDDYWGTTTYRPRAGSRSAWAAEVGDNSVAGAPNNVVHEYDNDMDASMQHNAVLSPTGYGGFMTYWSWLDSESGFDTLEVLYYDGVSWTTVASASGSSGGWTFNAVPLPPGNAQVEFVFVTDGSVQGYEGAYVDDVAVYEFAGQPNADAHMYDNDMDALMYHPVDLAGFTAAWMTFSYWLDAESGFDVLDAVYSPDGSTWFGSGPITGNSGGWIFANVTIPTTAQYVGFQFHSNGATVYEGAYVDDVVLTGTAPDLSCTGSSDSTTGMEGFWNFGFFGNASGGVPPYAWSWDFGDGATANMQNAGRIYTVAGTYTPTLTVTDDVGQTCAWTAPTVTVSHRGPLTVAITPPAGEVEEGAGLGLTATVRDYYNHDVSTVATIAWSVSPAACGSIVPAGATATLAADADAGGTACTVTASASIPSFAPSTGTASVAVVHAGPLTIEVTPATGAVDEGGRIALTATVTDAEGHDVTDDAVIAWTVSPAGCGSLSADEGAETTLAAARGGACTVTATATLGSDEAEDAAVVTVRAGVLGAALPFLILLIIAAVLVAVLLLVLRRRKRKPGPAFEQMQPAPAYGAVPPPPEGAPSQPPPPPGP